MDLFQYLHMMDDEANTPYLKRDHGGLVSYSIHYKKYKINERCWNDRLANLLTSKGFSALTEVKYPDSNSDKCDIVIQGNNVKIWLEVKSAWKRWFDSETGNLSEKRRSASYKGYLLGDVHRNHSSAQDIEKLNRLSNKDADYIGLLIIGFDTVDKPMEPDVEKLIVMTELQKQGWQIYGPEIWPDRNYPDCRYNCWFLGKKVAGI